MEISFYEMSYEDIPQIAAMEARYFGQPWSEAGIGHYMDAGNTLFLVAKDNSKVLNADEHLTRVVGYCAVMCVLDEGDLVSIAVDEEYRQMGIARDLLDIAYGMLKEAEVAKLHLEVRESNAPAIGLYESEGFVQDGKRPGFYSNPKEDALLYTKEL